MVRHVVILGGGFGGVYTAMHLEKICGRQRDVEITLINSENYFVFQPMLPEVISGSIEIQHIINPIRRLCPQTNLHMREVQEIDLAQKVVTTSPGFRPTLQRVQYDYLVIALGTVMNFSRMPGLKQHTFQFKNIGDALQLRNHIIHVLEEADKTARSRTLSQEHFGPGEIVFREGDHGDRVYLLVSGEVEVIHESPAGVEVIATLRPGECFGEMALLSDAPRNAGIRAVGEVDVLSVYRDDFQTLLTHLPGLREIFDKLMASRIRGAAD